MKTAGSNEEVIATFLEAWDMSVFHPVVLKVGKADIPDSEKQSIYTTLIAYVLRRELAGLTRKNYNKNASSILKAFEENEISNAALLEWFDGLTGDGSRMPSDGDVAKGIEVQPHYKLPKPKLRYLFKHIEMELRTNRQEDSPLSTEGLHIEHILPSSWHEHWPLKSGNDVLGSTQEEHIKNGGELLSQTVIEEMERRQKLKNTLGNLTILTSSLNPSIGNLGWEIKSGDKGLGDSLLQINKQIVRTAQWKDHFEITDPEQTGWDEDLILARSKTLSRVINVLWPIGY